MVSHFLTGFQGLFIVRLLFNFVTSLPLFVLFVVFVKVLKKVVCSVQPEDDITCSDL